MKEEQKRKEIRDKFWVEKATIKQRLHNWWTSTISYLFTERAMGFQFTYLPEELDISNEEFSAIFEREIFERAQEILEKHIVNPKFYRTKYKPQYNQEEEKE